MAEVWGGKQQTGLGTRCVTTPASAPVTTTLGLSLAALGVLSFQHVMHFGFL